MKRTEFETKLGLLKSASLARARMLVEDLGPSAARVDAALREDFQNTLLRLGLPCPAVSHVSLLPGEAWLLLYEAPREGWAVRLRAHYDGAAQSSDDQLSREVRRAHRGLLSSAARACRQLIPSTPPSIDLDVPYGDFELEGSSLGLSVAVAAVSAMLGRPPRTQVAGSAQVDDDGRLLRVEHLDAKLDALHRRWPEVTHVVVAPAQQLPKGYACPVQLVPCEHLAEACGVFGLPLEELPPGAQLDDFRDRVARFRTDNGGAPDAREWARLADVAWETSAALAAEEPEKSLEAALWAALFAVHSGDPNAADALFRRVPTEMTERFPELHVRRLITSASHQIDSERLDDAVASSARAVALCEDLSPRDRRELLGQALGTHGRALMHAGRLTEAEAAMRQAVEHHRLAVPREVPRSQCYLATCLRLAGRAEEALVAVNEAIADAGGFARRWNAVVTTGFYLHLERGRIYGALGRWHEATAEFLLVCDGQLEDAAYPRLGALRGLARALRVLGRMDAADDALRSCLSVTYSTSKPILQKVAAVAVGEALLDSSSTQVERSALEAAWTKAFAADATPEQIAAVLARWVY